MYGVLSRLAAQTVLPRRVILVDNGGTLTADDVAKMPLSDRLELISRPDNPGYGTAVNEARAVLGEESLLVLTHDAMFGDTLAELLLAAVNSAPDVGSVGPILHFVSQPDRVFNAGGRISAGGRAFAWPQPQSDKPYTVDWVDGAIVMFSSAGLAAIDWVDERYFLYFEDVDSGWRLGQAGFRNLIVPAALAYQEPGAHPMYLGIRNMTLFSVRAGVSPLRQFAAVVYRASVETLSRIKHGKPVSVAEVWRGWRDGRKGISGKPANR